jgi:L-fuconolactonase
MPWLDGNQLLDRPYGLAEYARDSAGLAVAALVYVQTEVTPAYGLLEARWAAQQAREDRRLQAIVAWAPLEDGERARSYLDALVAESPLVKGVRRLIQTESDPDFCLRPDFVAGVRLLPEYNLTFDLGISHRQLPAATELARRCPQVRFVLDHLAMPPIAARQLEPWRDDLRHLAELPNVLCKISGLATAADRQHWAAGDLAPYVEHALEVFGLDRVMFGGDWPVLLMAAPYRRWVETLDALTEDLLHEQRVQLWAANARRFYRLPAIKVTHASQIRLLPASTRHYGWVSARCHAGLRPAWHR